MTATVPLIPAARPLGDVARPSGDRVRVRRSLVLTSGGWLITAADAASSRLTEKVGPTRCSPVLVSAYPPGQAMRALEHLDGVDPGEQEAARVALAVDGGRRLWLFVGACHVLWSQQRPGDHAGLS